MSDTTSVLDLEQQIATIRRSQEETRKFVAEQHKLSAEAAKLARDHFLAPFVLIISTMAAGAALFGAGAAFMKLLHP